MGLQLDLVGHSQLPGEAQPETICRAYRKALAIRLGWSGLLEGFYDTEDHSKQDGTLGHISV